MRMPLECLSTRAVASRTDSSMARTAAGRAASSFFAVSIAAADAAAAALGVPACVGWLRVEGLEIKIRIWGSQERIRIWGRIGVTGWR
jgi:hypothetical protein